MTQFLPPNLLALFVPRDPIPYLPPAAELTHEKKSKGYLGVSSFLTQFEDPKDTPPPAKVETSEERVERRCRERAEQVAYKLEREIAIWDPNGAPNITGDPLKTIFVGRINYDTSESKLRREFERYGPIKKIAYVHNSENGKPRGYAFIEYEHERDMRSAYKHGDGKKIEGRRVLVDVERARTIEGWLPRRLGGGLGGTRRGGPDVNVMHSGREDNERMRERYRSKQRQLEERASERSRSRERRQRSRSPRRERRRRSKEKTTRGGADYDDKDGFDKYRGRSRDKESSRGKRSDRGERSKRKRSKSRDRDRKRERREKKRSDCLEYIKTEDRSEVRIKEEPIDDYNYSNYATNHTASVKVKREDEEKSIITNTNGSSRQYDNDFEEGEYY